MYLYVQLHKYNIDINNYLILFGKLCYLEDALCLFLLVIELKHFYQKNT